MAKLPVPTAKEINEAHQFAREHAETAVEWAVKCGQMLAAKKKDLGHGGFMEWRAAHCDFAQSTANRYMKAAKTQISTGVEISTLSQIYPATPKPKPALVKPTLTGETVEAGAGSKPVPAEPVAPKQEARADAANEPEWTEADEAAANDAAAADEQERIAKAMEADDKLAEAFAQIKHQAALLAAATQARDGYMRGKAEVTKLLKAEQRKVAKLEKELATLRRAAA